MQAQYSQQSSLLLLSLLGEENGVDVGENSTGSDGDSAQKLVELLVVLDGKGDVPGDDAGLLVVAGGVSGELKDLGAKVLKDGGHVDTGSHTDTGSVSSLLKVACQTGNGELKSSLGAGAHTLSLSASSFSFSCECWGGGGCGLVGRLGWGGVERLD